MAIWLSTTNYAANLGASSIVISGAAATGYSKTAMVDGSPARVFRHTESGGAVNHEIAFDLGSSRSVTCVWIIGARGTGATSIDQGVFVYYNTNTAAPAEFGGAGSWTQATVHTDDLNSRGDVFWDVRAAGLPAVKRYWKILLGTDTANATIDIGEIGIGTITALTKAAATRVRSPSYGTVVNVSDTGNVFAAQIAAKRTSYELEFPPMTSAHDAEVEAVFDATEGAYSPLLFVPDSSDLTTFFHGRIEDSQSTQTDRSGLQYGRRLLFTESGRGL